MDLLRSWDFNRIKISIKASDVHRTVSAYRILSAKTDLPLHIGITEAGTLYPGIVKSSIGIGMLLSQGIGDTIRVSLTRDPVEEVRVGFEILKALNIRRRGPEIISCPTCGRCEIDLFDMVERIAVINDACTVCGACVDACKFDAIIADIKHEKKQDLSGYKGVWVFCEQIDGVVQSISYELLGEGRKLADRLGVELAGVLLGSNVKTLVADIEQRGG